MGPGLTPKGELPDFVDTPTGIPGADLAAVVNEGDLGEAEYEALRLALTTTRR